MKSTFLLLTLLGFAALTGCTADDLAGPDAATIDDTAAPALTSPDETARTSRPSSLMGAWRASDRAGSITLFLDEPDSPSSSDPSAAQSFSGKGIVSSPFEAPFAVSVDGEQERRVVVFALTNARGEPIAKVEGTISTNFAQIKVVLIDESGQQRDLVFDRI